MMVAFGIRWYLLMIVLTVFSLTSYNDDKHAVSISLSYSSYNPKGYDRCQNNSTIVYANVPGGHKRYKNLWMK